ncbi:hypothetical protein [Pseudostreptobacillus hongkongensis]|uniref:hypothetical protein n=1 Tax=Pseudostreptobacillus hongkongensis TaxID=1162717 RepID=UPI00082C0EE0|nr:hypothetical protein [Pseudostreptobacillus hongkongensis]
MLSKYVYDENLKYLDTFFDEIEDKDILAVYNKAYITNEFIEYPKLENGNIKSMSDNEISQIKYKKYINKEYVLQSNEIINNDRIISVELKEFEYIENGVLKFNLESKKEYLINKTKSYEEAEKERDFEYKGYLQPNRELEDQTSLLKILSFMQITKQTHFDKWKMKDKEGHEHYITLTIQEMMELGQIMQTQTTKAMIKWSTIREKIKAMSEEEIKVYELPKE